MSELRKLLSVIVSEVGSREPMLFNHVDIDEALKQADSTGTPLPAPQQMAEQREYQEKIKAAYKRISPIVDKVFGKAGEDAAFRNQPAASDSCLDDAAASQDTSPASLCAECKKRPAISSGPYCERCTAMFEAAPELLPVVPIEQLGEKELKLKKGVKAVCVDALGSGFLVKDKEYILEDVRDGFVKVEGSFGWEIERFRVAPPAETVEKTDTYTHKERIRKVAKEILAHPREDSDSVEYAFLVYLLNLNFTDQSARIDTLTAENVLLRNVFGVMENEKIIGGDANSLLVDTPGGDRRRIMNFGNVDQKNIINSLTAERDGLKREPMDMREAVAKFLTLPPSGDAFRELAAAFKLYAVHATLIDAFAIHQSTTTELAEQLEKAKGEVEQLKERWHSASRGSYYNVDVLMNDYDTLVKQRNEARQERDGAEQAVREREADLRLVTKLIKPARLLLQFGMRRFAIMVGILPSRFCSVENGAPATSDELSVIVNTIRSEWEKKKFPAAQSGEGKTQ